MKTNLIFCLRDTENAEFIQERMNAIEKQGKISAFGISAVYIVFSFFIAAKTLCLAFCDASATHCVAAISRSDVERDPIQISCNKALVLEGLECLSLAV